MFFFLPGMGRWLRCQASGLKCLTNFTRGGRPRFVGCPKEQEETMPVHHWHRRGEFGSGLTSKNGEPCHDMKWVEMNTVFCRCRTLFFALDVACWAPMAPTWSPSQRKQVGSLVRLTNQRGTIDENGCARLCKGRYILMKYTAYMSRLYGKSATHHRK